MSPCVRASPSPALLCAPRAQRVAEEVSAATSAAESPLRFLERFRALADACDRLSAKPFREDIALSAEEFEREIRLAVARPDTEREVLQKLLAVKDQMIWCGREGQNHLALW